MKIDAKELKEEFSKGRAGYIFTLKEIEKIIKRVENRAGKRERYEPTKLVQMKEFGKQK